MARKSAARKLKSAYYAQWLPWSDGCKRVFRATGSWELAAVELKDKLASGQIKTMKRVTCGDKVEEYKLSAEDWSAAGISARRDLSRSATADNRDGYLRCYVTDKNQLRHGALTEPKDIEWHHIFFRRRDIDALWPIEPVRPADMIAKPDHRKPGPKPTHDWQIEVAAELFRIIYSAAGKIPDNDSAVARQLCEFCENQWNWQPDESAVRKLIKRLLRRVR